jgi:hypothetical protein
MPISNPSITIIGGSSEQDGGSASSVYLPDQVVDGGGASG